MWVILSKSVNVWQAWAHVMQPATVTRWHRTAFRQFWRWKSRRKRGRRPISEEMQELIRKLSQENPLWSAERIRDTLLLLQYDPPGEDTIRKYMLNQTHLDRLLRQYIEAYYHVARPHQGLDGDTPVPHEKWASVAGPTKLISTPVLCGLHHTCIRVAA